MVQNLKIAPKFQSKIPPLTAEEHSQLEEEKSCLEAAQKELEVAECRETVNLERFQQELEALVRAKSFHPAQLFEILMRKKNRQVHAVPYDFLGESVDYMEEGDLLILFSVSGRPQIMPEIQNTKCDILLVTANPKVVGIQGINRAVVLPYFTADPEASSISRCGLISLWSCWCIICHLSDEPEFKLLQGKTE